MARRQSSFTVVAVLMLACGIGANTAIFRIVNEAFLRSAPGVTDAHRLVALGRRSAGQAFDGFGYLSFLEYRQARAFSGVLAYRGATLLWHERDAVLPIDAQLVTANYFGVLGVRVAPGRDFLAADDTTPAASPVAIISQHLWRTRFGADPAAIGRQLHLNETAFTLVGVAAPGFRGVEAGEAVDLWLPLMMEAAARPAFPVLNSDLFTSLSVVGRLRPGVSLGQAEAEMAVLASRIERPRGRDNRPAQLVLTPNVRLPNPRDRADVTMSLAPLWASAVLVLAIVCANLASLLLAHSAARRKEIAIRLALGATRRRVVLDMIGETLALAVPGALGALVVSSLLTALIQARIGLDVDLRIDARVVLFAAALAMLSGMAFAAPAALQATRGALLRDLAGQRTSTAPRSPLRRVLVSGQVAACLVLLTTAGLFVRTLQKAAAADVGFETRHLFLARLDVDLAGYSDARARALYRLASERLAAAPGVESASCASAAPVDRGFWGTREIVLDGAAPDAARLEVEHNEIAPRYFATLGVPILRGRDFVPNDDKGAPLVAIVNETMARSSWPHADPLGQRLRVVRFLGLSPPIEIVGIARDTRIATMQDRMRPEVFLPLDQSNERNATVLVRATTTGAAGIAGLVREELRRLDPALPPIEIETVAERISSRLSDQKLNAELAGLFAGLGLVLAALGLYATQAFDVAQRTREIGVRIALGATPRRVVWMITRQGLAVAVAGAAAGLAGSFAAARYLASRLYGVAPTDSVAFLSAAAVLVGASLLASWLPVRRAAEVDPALTLRAE